MLIEDKPLNNFWYKALQERTGLNERTIYDRINDSPTYKVIKDQGALTLKNRFNKTNTHKFLKNLSFSEQLTQALEMEKGMPRFTGMGKLAGGNYALSPKFKAMEFAKRNWHANRGEGLIKFFDKNGKRIDWAYGVELPYKDVSFSYGGKRHNIEKLNDVQYLKKHFPKVYETQTAINNLRTTEIDDPLKKGKKITLEDLVKRNQVNTYKWGAGTSTFDILHGKKGVKGEPFTNLSFNTRDINQIEMGIVRDKTLSQTKKNNLVKSLYKLTGSGDPEAIKKRQVALTGDIKSGKISSYEDMKNLVLKKLGNKVTNKEAGFIATDILKDFGKMGLKGGRLLKMLELQYEPIFEGLFYQYAKQYKGYDHGLAREELFLPKMIAKAAPDLWEKVGFKPFKTGVWEGADPLIEEQLREYGGGEYIDRTNKVNREVDKYHKLENDLSMMQVSSGDYAAASPEEIKAKEKEIENQRNLLIDLEHTLKPGTPAYEAYMRAKEIQDYEFGKNISESDKRKETRRHKEYLEHKGGKQRSFLLPKEKGKERVEDPLFKKPYTFLETDDTFPDILKPGKKAWEEFGLTDTQVGPVIKEGIKDKWKQIYDMGGIDLMDKIGIAGGVANMADGGIMSLKKK